MSARFTSSFNSLPRITHSLWIAQSSYWSIARGKRCLDTPLAVQNQRHNFSVKAKDTPSQPPAESNRSGTSVFSELNVLGSVPPPASAIEAIYDDGFLVSNGVQFRDGSGVMLIHDEAFKWRPVIRKSSVEEKAIKTGQLELGKKVWGMLDVLHPKPELLIIGTGKRTLQLSKIDRDTITELGIRIDAMDTSHAAAQYNLLATERPKGQIAAALLVDQFGVN
ncbi:hypothetical protein EDC01DRAFT_710842 [Geopyxis carbonaria]|nr:hypothetical protein EDC01DRAFT_710842 [Geopyxis carbonaria]